MMRPRAICLAAMVAASMPLFVLAAPKPAVRQEVRHEMPSPAGPNIEVLPEHLLDEPPPTLWDRRGEESALAGVQRDKVGDNQSLLMQLVRTIVALCGVLFLIWAMAKVIGPRLGRVLGGKRSEDMQVTDRLNLDGRNTLVRVSMADGRSYLIACGDHAIKLIDTVPSATQASRPVPFAQAMGAQGVPEE